MTRCRPRPLSVLLAATIIAGLGVAVDAGAAASDTSSDRLVRELPAGWYARIDTRMGSIVLRLHPEQAPQATAHFAGLAQGTLPWTDVVSGEVRQGHFYDGLTVHRAEAASHFEAGDPYGTGNGYPKMFVPLETGGPIDFSMPWRMGLTRAPLGRIPASQFFITASRQPLFSGRHPCLGTVVIGKDVVLAITSVKTYRNGRPIEPVILERVRVFPVGDPPPLAEPVPFEPKTEKFGVREGIRRY